MEFKQKERQSLSYKTTENLKQSFASGEMQNIGDVNIERSKTLNLNDTAELFKNEFESLSDFESKNADENPKLLHKEVPAGPKYVGIEKCFAEKQKGDSDRMIAVRNALKAYHDYMDANKGTNGLYETWTLLKGIVSACKSYRFLRFSIFKRGEAKKRLEEVIALQEKATAMVEDAHTNMQNAGIQDNNTIRGFYKGDQKDETGYVWTNIKKRAEKARRSKLRNNTSTTQKVVAGTAAAFGFILYNPIRLIGTALLTPIWALNEGIRAVERAVSGGWAHRPIKLGWQWTPNQLAFNVLEKLDKMNDHYVEIGERNLSKEYWDSIDKFKQFRGVTVNKKDSTIEFTKDNVKHKYRISFDPYAEENRWYEIDEENNSEKEIDVSEEPVIIDECIKISKNKVKKSFFRKDIEKRMRAEMAELDDIEDSLTKSKYDPDLFTHDYTDDED